MKNKKGIVIVLAIFLLVVIVDLYSTLQLGELVQYLEANPIYHYVGLPGIIALNLCVMAVCYYSYNKDKKIHRRFAIINCLVTITVVRILVIINNFKVKAAQPTLDQAMAVTAQMKAQAVIRIAELAFLPFLIGFISYWLFCLDHKIEVKNA